MSKGKLFAGALVALGLAVGLIWEKPKVRWYVTGGKTEVKLQGFDSVAQPGSRVQLRAKLERDWILGMHPDIKAERLEFYLGDQMVGTAVTDHAGIAAFDYTAGPEGLYECHVQLPEESMWTSGPAPILLASVPADAHIVACDIDGTIADTQTIDMLVSNLVGMGAIADSSAVLTEVTKTHRIFYVTARPEALIRPTKEWLRTHGYPLCPVFFWNWHGVPLSHGKYKMELIGQLKKTWKSIEVGFGDRTEDGEAYLANNLRPYILHGSSSDLPKGVIWVKNWKEIREALAKDKAFQVRSEGYPTAGTPLGDATPAGQ